MSMKYTTIAWDWNGTLLDDARICMECVNDMLRKRNMPVLDLETYRSVNIERTCSVRALCCDSVYTACACLFNNELL